MLSANKDILSLITSIIPSLFDDFIVMTDPS